MYRIKFQTPEGRTSIQLCNTDEQLNWLKSWLDNRGLKYTGDDKQVECRHGTHKKER